MVEEYSALAMLMFDYADGALPVCRLTAAAANVAIARAQVVSQQVRRAPLAHIGFEGCCLTWSESNLTRCLVRF